MTNEEKKKLYAALSAPFPEEAIERTKGSVTGKGYDTAGVRAQFLINRLNEVLGLGCYRIHRTIEVRPITTAKGRTMYEGTADMSVELGEWVDGKFQVIAESLADGGHVSFSMIDAKKGAHTGALKRALAGFGIGKAAWEGKLDNAPDDDNLPGEVDGVAAPPMTTVVRAPAKAPAAAAATRPQPQSQTPDRGRISSKQVAAIMSISRKMGTEPAALRSRIKTQFNCQLEFLSREQASLVITSLQAQLNANGSGHHHADPPAESLAS